MCKMAQLLKSDSVYDRYKDILKRGSAAFDKLLWNGEFSLILKLHDGYSQYRENRTTQVTKVDFTIRPRYEILYNALICVCKGIHYVSYQLAC